MNATIDMTAVIAKSAELDNDLVKVKKELKRIASVKCRLKKAPGRVSYQSDMTACLQEEQLLKNVKAYLDAPRKTVNDLTEEDIAIMPYDEVCRAIRSIQSKKTHTKWAEDCKKDASGLYIPGSGEAYLEARRIEELLLTRRAELKPVGTTKVSIAKLRALIDELRFIANDIDATTALDRIEAFLEGGESDEASSV